MTGAGLDFSDIILQNAEDVILRRAGPGERDARGRWHPSEEEIHRVRVAVFNLTPEDLRVYEPGTFNVHDVKVFAPGGLRDEDAMDPVEILEGDFVEWRGSVYKVTEHRDNLRHGNFVRAVARLWTVGEEEVEEEGS